MDWATYKSLCDRPDYWSRWMLSQTAALLELGDESALAERITASLLSPPLNTPDDHKGTEATDMFRLTLSHAESERILRVISMSAENGITTKETETRGLGGFVEAWSEFVRYLAQQRT